MAKRKFFYQELLHKIPVYLSFGKTIDYSKPTKALPERITGFGVYDSKDSYCFGANKPISKLIENESNATIL